MVLVCGSLLILRRPSFPVHSLDAPQREWRLPLSATPHRDPYCKSLLQRWFSLPAGQFLEVSLSFSSVSLSVLSLPSLPQLGPHVLTAVSPFHHPTVFLNPDKGHFYSVDSFSRQFIARQYSHPTTLTRK